MHDPRDPALQRWLRALKPRAELTARYALTAKFPAMRRDPDFVARIAELLEMLRPSEAELAAIRKGAAFFCATSAEEDTIRPARARVGKRKRRRKSGAARKSGRLPRPPDAC